MDGSDMRLYVQATLLLLEHPHTHPLTCSRNDAVDGTYANMLDLTVMAQMPSGQGIVKTASQTGGGDTNEAGDTKLEFEAAVTVKAGQLVTGDGIPFGTTVASDVTAGTTVTISKAIATGGLCTGTYTTALPCKVEFGGTPRYTRMVANGNNMEIQDIYGMLEALAASTPTVVAPKTLYT